MMQRILIIGTNSFIGTNFRKSSIYSEISEVSLLENRLEDIEFDNVDVVLHLAALVHQSKKIRTEEYFNVNRDLPIKVAEQAKRSGVKQFIFLSTVKVYGKFIPGSEPWNEDSSCYPEDNYGMSKFQAENDLKKLDGEGFNVSIIRTPIVYGPGVVANILKLIKLIELFPVLPFRKVNNNRHYTNVDNLVGYIDRIIELRLSGTFIAMDENPMSTSDLVSSISKLLNRKILLFSLPDFVVKVGVFLMPGTFDRLFNSFYLDNKKTRLSLNYVPPFSIEDGLMNMISYYKFDNETENRSGVSN